MPYGRDRRSWVRTLRFRLMVWNAIVVVLTACVTLVALREGVRITLVRELDQVLGEDLREIDIALRAHEDRATLYEQLDRKDSGHVQHKWFAQLTSLNGEVLYRSSHAPVGELAVAAAAGGRAQSVGEWRFVSQVAPAAQLVVCVGASQDLMRADIARLNRFVVLCAAGVLVGAPLCGYWLAGRATRPLARIIATAARLRPAHLNERLPLQGTDDELDRLSQTLNRLLDQIGKYLQEHRDLLANSAHELRTPLAAIRSSIEVALSGQRTREEYEELLTEVLEESGSLELLVNQLLLLSESEAERLKARKEQVDLGELIERAMDMFGGVAEYRDIRLDCPALPAVIVDGNRQHLRQVIHNLLDNALKFTPAGGRVAVQLQCDAVRQEALLVVADTGPGIPAEDLPHVFDRFFQGQRSRSGTVERRGTGLGLSICQAIMQAHDGSIDVVCPAGGGARFTVRMPCRGDQPPTRTADRGASCQSNAP